MISMYLRRMAVSLFTLVLLAGCAGLRPDLDPPIVNLVSLQSLSGEGGAPRFEIKLRVINPNKQPLDIAGISYTVEVLDRQIIAGVANDVAPIEGYGEGDITLEASLQLLQLLRLMASLPAAGSEAPTYKFSAKIDFKGFMPTQRIEETGKFTLN